MIKSKQSKINNLLHDSSKKEITEVIGLIKASKYGHEVLSLEEKIDSAFRRAVMYFADSGDTSQLTYLINAFSDKNKMKLIKYFRTELPVKWDYNKQLFKVLDKWQTSMKDITIHKLQPFNKISIKAEPKTGLIKIDKSFLSLAELNNFMLDAIVLFRNELEDEQVKDLYETISKVHDKRDC